MFNFQAYNQSYIESPGLNDADPYDVEILPYSPPSGEPGEPAQVFRCIGVHHLMADENNGNHHVYVDILDPLGNRASLVKLGWTWDGRKPSEPADPIPCQKPANEPGWNIALGIKQTVSLWIEGANSDVVRNIHTRHADEPHGNTIGHHSFYVVFQLQVPEPPPIADDPPITGKLPEAWRERLVMAVYQLQQVIALLSVEELE